VPVLCVTLKTTKVKEEIRMGIVDFSIVVRNTISMKNRMKKKMIFTNRWGEGKCIHELALTSAAT
jgi:hypothetical protein